MYISDIQRSTMKKIESVVDNKPKGDWFTQYELPGVTRNTMDALLKKGFLESESLPINGIVYYRFVRRIDNGND
uniref:Uncharacterized protein n=1 Tax=viral metagenome TaxID=1070528 RepID=A0A6M3X712_9ZZZZ